MKRLTVLYAIFAVGAMVIFFAANFKTPVFPVLSIYYAIMAITNQCAKS